MSCFTARGDIREDFEGELGVGLQLGGIDVETVAGIWRWPPAESPDGMQEAGVGGIPRRCTGGVGGRRHPPQRAGGSGRWGRRPAQKRRVHARPSRKQGRAGHRPDLGLGGGWVSAWGAQGARSQGPGAAPSSGEAGSAPGRPGCGGGAGRIKWICW